MSHFSNLDKIEGARTYQPFPAFRNVKWRAEKILKGRKPAALECAASYVFEAIEKFNEEYKAGQIEVHVKRLLENSGWELHYLQRHEYHPDDPSCRLPTEDEIRDLLNNWPSDADDSPTYYEIDDINSLGDILCSGDTYQWDWIDGCKNATEAELYAVLALTKLDDAAKALFVSEPRNEKGTVIYQPATAMGATKAIDAANFLIEAVESIGAAEREVERAWFLNHKEEVRDKFEAAWKAERAEIAESERKVRAEAGRIGAAVKNQKHAALKQWALQKAEAMKDQDIDIARKLAAQIPSHLAEVSKNSERLIYDALRTRKKPD